jgi:hypothetical protein
MSSGFATGNEFLRGLPREATPVHRSLGEVGCPSTCPSKSSNAGRSWKPFTWASGLEQRPKFMGEKLQNLKPREAKPFTRKFMAKWEIRFQRFAISFRPFALGLCRFRLPLAFSLQPLAFASGANEKFHLPLTSKSKSAKGQALQGENVKILGPTLLGPILLLLFF